MLSVIKPNTKQLELLEEFKKNVAGVKAPFTDDDYYIRWLVARQWDLKKAEKMFRDSMEWRRQFGTDDLYGKWKVPEVLEKYGIGGYYGHDKKGHPIWYELIGKVDLKDAFGLKGQRKKYSINRLMLSVPKKDIVKFRIYDIEVMIHELLPKYSEKVGHKVDQCVYIVDLEGVGTKHMWLPAVSVYTELLAAVEANYPEGLYCAYVINAPKIFPLLYGLVKNFLAEETRGKIKILGKNWKEALLKDIDADQIPVHWGGTAKDADGDPYCKSKIHLGGTIPEKYHQKAAKQENVNTDDFASVTVGKGSTSQVEYEVEVAGSVLRWNFWTDDKDISFGVYRRTGDSKQKISDMEEVVTNSRVNCHMVPEADSFICEKPGTYVVRFDNSYSWVNSKKVSYKIEVCLPDAGKELQRLDSTDF